MALMIGCIWHGLDALQGNRAKPGNHLVENITLQCPFVCVYLSVPPFFDMTVGPQPNFARIMWIDLGIIRT